MIKKINKQIDQYNTLNDIHQYQLLLDTANLFLNTYPNGVETEEELDLGIKLLRELISLTYIASDKQYESNFELEKEIRYCKIKVFKMCIPASHSKLRGLTELLLGMKEDIVK